MRSTKNEQAVVLDLADQPVIPNASREFAAWHSQSWLCAFSAISKFPKLRSLQRFAQPAGISQLRDPLAKEF
jgi:hypothetical protein